MTLAEEDNKSVSIRPSLQFMNMLECEDVNLTQAYSHVIKGSHQTGEKYLSIA